MSLNISKEKCAELLIALMTANADRFSLRPTTRSKEFAPTNSGHFADIVNEENPDNTIEEEQARRWLKGESRPTRPTFERVIASFPLIPAKWNAVIEACLNENSAFELASQERPDYPSTKGRLDMFDPQDRTLVDALIDRFIKTKTPDVEPGVPTTKDQNLKP